jgi:hypothetical protein
MPLSRAASATVADASSEFYASSTSLSEGWGDDSALPRTTTQQPPNRPRSPTRKELLHAQRALLYVKEEAAYTDAVDKAVRLGAYPEDPLLDANGTLLEPPDSPGNSPTSHKARRHLLNDDPAFIDARLTLAKALFRNMTDKSNLLKFIYACFLT